jgi:hypothetical protein
MTLALVPPAAMPSTSRLPRICNSSFVEETKAMIPEDDGQDLVLTELYARTPEEALEDAWFAERRRGISSPPPRRASVAPIGDDEVDPWLR